MDRNRKRAKQDAPAPATTSTGSARYDAPVTNSRTMAAPAVKPGVARSAYANQQPTTSSGSGKAISASKANKGGRRTSSGIKSKSVRSKSGADCFKGGKGCGPSMKKRR